MVPVVILAASDKLLAVVAVPVRFPVKLVAVTTSVNLPSPKTVSFEVGFVVPIPTEPIPVILTLSFAANTPPVKNERYFATLLVAIPIDKLPSEVYKYPSNAPLIVQEPEEKVLLLMPKSIKFVVSDPASDVAIKSAEALVPAREFLMLSCV